MFLSKILSYFWGSREEESLEEAFQTLKPTEPEEDPKESEKEIDDKTSIKKTGVITLKNGNVYTIDDVHKYTSEEELEVGGKVSYTLYRDGTAKKITNVEKIIDGWDDYEISAEKKWFHSTKVGEVVKRDGRILHVSPGDFKVNLNTVSSVFIPNVGDWVQMDVKSVLDEQVLNYCGDTLEITKIYPLRTKMIKGLIQSYNQITYTGHINKDVYFDRESLFEGYFPKRGDSVVAEVIESNQGVYNWRAIKVILQNSAKRSDLFDFELPTLVNYENDVEGIKITDNIYVESTGFKDNVFFNIQISNDTDEPVVLNDVKFDSRNSQVKLVQPDLSRQLEIKVGFTEMFKFVINAKSMGETVETVIFAFEKFKVGRPVRINLKSRVNNYNRKYNNYYNRDSNVASMRDVRRKEGGEVIPGRRAGVPIKFRIKQLKEFKVPDSLWEIFLQYEESREDRGKIYRTICERLDCVKGDVNFGNYEERFHALLHMNEIETVIAMRKYDMDFACFIRNNEYLMLEVENLAEMRPSIIIGDKIVATSVDENCPKKYEGFVHKVTGKYIYLKFAPIMHESYNGECYSVHVVQSRMLVRKLHHALSLAVQNLGQEFLFPSRVVEKQPQCSFISDEYKDNNKEKIIDEIVSPVRKKTNKEILEAMRNFVTRSGGNKFDGEKTGDEEESVINENKENMNDSVKCDKLYTNDVSKLENSTNGFDESNSDPSKQNGNQVQKLKIMWHDLKLNYYQKEAVRNILLGVARPLPYIIFGPPGTGKTVTVVESIVQILKMIPGARILVATPSNSAADIIALRLIDNANMKPGEMVRFVSYKYAADDLIPAKLLPFSCTANLSRPGTGDEEVVCENGLKLGSSIKTLGRHLVTVGTCGSIGTLHCMGFPKGHFTHVIVDEAGQCTEPEILTSLTFLDGKEGQAILAGDPMQLGPVIFSKHASQFGLSESFLERLLNRFPYTRDAEGFPKTNGYDPRLVTCLVYNYRSLPGIIHMPNVMFYHSELKSTLDESSPEYKMLDKVKEILPHSSALVFHGLNSQNYQHEDSPSWFNPDEASQVFYYLNELYRLGLKSTDIGIISPYIKQVKHIREICQEAEFEVPKVGTVEEFQGSEYNVIILSTVRSNKDLIRNDLTHSLGFVSNPKRMNVALTRAQALCVIIGNPFLLINDVHWRAVILHCVQNGAYTGCEFNENMLK